MMMTDGQESYRVSQWKEGRVLSADDIHDLDVTLTEAEAEFDKSVDHHDQGRRQALLEVGGQELLDAVDARDQAAIIDIIANAMNRMKLRNKGKVQ